MPTFVDLQGLLRICREGSSGAEKGSRSIPLHFCKPSESTYKIRQILRFLIDCESSWIAMGRWDDPVQHLAKHLITSADWPKTMMFLYMLRDIKNENS